MPPDKGHGTSQAQPTHPTPDPAPSPIPSRQLLSHLTSALWPRKNIIIIKMKMKQRKRERERVRKREQKETARNKIKEMLFHNANCAASITPPYPLYPPADPLSTTSLVLMSNVKRMRRLRPIVAGERRAPKRNMEMRREIRKMRYLM